MTTVRPNPITANEFCNLYNDSSNDPKMPSTSKVVDTENGLLAVEQRSSRIVLGKDEVDCEQAKADFEKAIPVDQTAILATCDAEAWAILAPLTDKFTQVAANRSRALYNLQPHALIEEDVFEVPPKTGGDIKPIRDLINPRVLDFDGINKRVEANPRPKTQIDDVAILSEFAIGQGVPALEEPRVIFDGSAAEPWSIGSTTPTSHQDGVGTGFAGTPTAQGQLAEVELRWATSGGFSPQEEVDQYGPEVFAALKAELSARLDSNMTSSEVAEFFNTLQANPDWLKNASGTAAEETLSQDRDIPPKRGGANVADIGKFLKERGWNESVIEAVIDVFNYFEKTKRNFDPKKAHQHLKQSSSKGLPNSKRGSEGH